MSKEVQIDLPNRKELRYIVPNSEGIMAKLDPYIQKKNFSHNEIVQTIYFNNDNHDVPFSLSLKARRYLPDYTEKIILNHEQYFLDIKQGQGTDKQKVRLEGNLEELTNIINQKFNFSKTPLRPFIAIEYCRHHWTPINNENIRLTLDNDLRYYYFPLGKQEAVAIGRESSYNRLEIKISEPDIQFLNIFDKTIKEDGLFPIVSKKFTGYFFLSQYQTSLSSKAFVKELKGYEIESKIEAESDIIFPRIRDFCVNSLENFEIPKHFPYVFDGATINRYYRNDDNIFKAMLKRDFAEIVRKSDIEIIKDEFNLNCVTKRLETKGQEVPLDSYLLSSSVLQSELLRMRKAF